MLTEKQLKLRINGIGGSDAAAVAGLNKYKTPVDVYMQKLGLTQKHDEAGEPAYWGNVLEPIVAREFELREGKKICIEPNLLQHEKYPWMIANIDRRIEGENAILECKTTSSLKYSEWGEEGSDNIPDSYLIQVAHYAIVCDAAYVAVAVLIGGQNFKTYRYERNKELEDDLIEIEHNFWNNHVLKKIPPEPTNLNDVNKLWRNANDNYKTIPPELEDHIKSYRYALIKLKELQEQLDFDKQKICNYLGECSFLLNSSGMQIASWKEQETERLNTRLLKNDYPDLYKQYSNLTKTRVLRIKEFK